MEDSGKPKVRLALAGRTVAARGMPAPLQAASRGVGRGEDPFVNERVVQTREVVDLSRRARDTARETIVVEADAESLLVLETEDGFNLVVRADKLDEDFARLAPSRGGEGVIELDAIVGRGSTRGIGDWLFNRVSVVDLGRDEISDRALAKLSEWLGGKAVEWAEIKASRLGTKALMWAIENRLDRAPGLYRWLPGSSAERLLAVTPDQLAADAASGPLLVFVHGTASSTTGSFDDLHGDAAREDWAAIAANFGGRVYALEHHTFSQSPIDNALDLVDVLPSDARVHLVSHSRGGLVCDLMCMDVPGKDVLAGYKRRYPRLPRGEGRDADRRDVEQLGALAGALSDKRIVVERYVRVASPARGTRLASANFDVFLSALLSLVGRLTPLQGSLLYSAFKRIVLEIAHNRTDPALVPGIEAMLPESPLAAFLGRVQRRPGTRMAVIAGDIEGGGLLKRLGVMFTDHVFFDAQPNDLVVDTDSMLQGVARAGECHARFEQGPDINHFRYFTNTGSRRALRRWLTAGSPGAADGFETVPARGANRLAELTATASRGARGGDAPAVGGARPVVFVLPGIMGSHLEIRSKEQLPGEGNRIWFDFGELVAGGLRHITLGNDDARVEAPFEHFYGELCEHLRASHDVVPFPYDWRRPVADEAARLATVLRRTLDGTSQPVRVLAHSMGGLVARAAFAAEPALWPDIVARDGGRFVMLGTPNRGSHLMVETLLGKSDTIRNLARIDVRHDMRQILDIVAGFPGALALLPRPGFVDGGGPLFGDELPLQFESFFDPAVWTRLRGLVRDFWFGDHIAAQPSESALSAAAALWNTLLHDNTAPTPGDRVAYVFGNAPSTPCGLQVDDGGLRLLRTSRGDGSVSWDSGRLDGLPEDRYWYMPADHGALTMTEAHFAAITELLDTGSTERLPQQAPARRDVQAVVAGDAGPVPYPSEEEMFYGVLGSRPPALVERGLDTALSVGMTVMDLRYAQRPVLCGHCAGDVIAGAEARIDRHLVKGELGRRQRLGRYAEQVGEAVVVLSPRTAVEIQRDTAIGAVVVGLGPLGRLGGEELQRTVRAGALAYLMHWAERDRALGRGAEAPVSLKLASLLLGYNSTTEISIEGSIDAIVLAVCEANRQFAQTMDSPYRIGSLEFIELFLDNAITGAYALRDLPARLQHDLAALGARVTPNATLSEGRGRRDRLYSGGGFGYWPLLRITDADRVSEDCPPECYRSQSTTPVPDEAWQAAAIAHGYTPPASRIGEGADTLSGLHFAERLQFELTAARARVSRVRQQRQPGLVERLVAKSIGSAAYREDFARTLYHLLVPVGFKSVVRQQSQLVLQVDEYTANIPWEMLVIDGEPVVRHTRLVRKFITSRNSQRPEPHGSNAALVIGDPSTTGFDKVFGAGAPAQLASLGGARSEARAVVDELERARIRVHSAVDGEDVLAVMNKLYAEPYRIVHIAAHGVFNMIGTDGVARTGVVLSDGALLTAAEIGQLDYAPELVFLNCCHLAKTGTAHASANRLAYSLARELIDMDVRCVIVAGWAVEDEAAKIFARTFYRHLLSANGRFGDAVHVARLAVLDQRPATNTWGAYQAYGDAGYTMHTERDGHRDEDRQPFTSPHELHAFLRGLVGEANHLEPGDSAARDDLAARADTLLARAPDEWRAAAGTQFLLGTLYRQLGDDYLDQTRAALGRAVSSDKGSADVPVSALEKLSNAEAIHAVWLGEHGRRDEALALIDTAIARLQMLVRGTGSTPRNVERSGVLGSALKRKAGLLALPPAKAQRDIVRVLEEAAAAYKGGAGSLDDGDGWCLLNWLQLQSLLDTSANDVVALAAAARRCGEKSDRKFATSLAFFDAVTRSDALLAECMLDGSLVENEARLVKSYEDALAGVASSRRQFGSVVKQHRLLATLARALGKPAIADSLERIADTMDPPARPAAPAPGAKASTPRRRTATRKTTPNKAKASKAAAKKAPARKASARRKTSARATAKKVTSAARKKAVRKRS